ncbi:MAG TPA: Fis family transcriptional regulator [Planctomycetes bacterium]|nr:Fis family transcriptional regulator [Planctomycetota bacterium]
MEGDALRIGKSGENDFVLADQTVSRIHCEIVREARGYLLRDLGSTNGTLLDGAEIREVYLRPGAILTVGKIELKVRTFAERIEVLPSERELFGGAVGKSAPMREIFGLLEKLAPSDATVLLGGETGTGKDVLARAIHEASPRKERPLIVVDCGAVVGSLIESELFGHEKGAFTGATAARQGAFELADGGTLFLDEIGELPLDLQPKLLRVLEQRAFRRVGGNREQRVDVRIVAASKRNLKMEVERGKFREDLYFRIHVIRIEVPPLRDRKEDVPTLAEAFLRDLGRPPSDLSPKALEVLLRHSWPGNIRELRNALERSCMLAGSGPIEPKHLGIDKLTRSSGSTSGSRGMRTSSGTTAGKVEYHGFILNRRQVTLLDYLRANGVATNREYVQLVNVSVPTGWRDLKDLLDKGLVRSEGQGRNTVYRLTDDAPISNSEG